MKGAVCCGVCAALLAAFVPLTAVGLPAVLRSQIPPQVDLTPAAQALGDDAMIFPMWEHAGAIQIDGRQMIIYMMDFTNAADVLKTGAKPNFTEVGPFVYGEGSERYDLEWSDEDDLLSYNEWMFYKYIPGPDCADDIPCSKHPEDMLFTVPNLSFLGLYYGASAIKMAEHLENAVQAGDHAYLSSMSSYSTTDFVHIVQTLLVDTLFVLPGLRAGKSFDQIQLEMFAVQLTVKELAFGFDDPILARVSECDIGLGDDVCGILSNETQNCSEWIPRCQAATIFSHESATLKLLHKLGVCDDIVELQAASKFLVAHCPEAVKTLVPPRFPGIGLINITSRENATSPDVDRKNKIHTGATDSEDAFTLTTRFGMENYLLCGNAVGINPGLPCPDNAEPTMMYKTPEASKVKGLGGNNLRPFLDGSESNYYWVDPLARALKIKWYGDKVHNKGIENYRYKIDETEMQTADENPAMDDYFQYGSAGMFNLTGMMNGVPIFLCQPHFLDVKDTEILDSVDGLAPPNVEDHGFSIDVEPTTGVIMGASGRLQINARGVPLQNATVFGKGLANPTGDLFDRLVGYPKLHMPVASLSDGGYMSSESAEDWKSSVGLIQKAQPIMEVIFAVLAILCVAATVGLCMLSKRRKVELESEESLRPSEEDAA